ncbi:DUF6841 family protein [Aliterella atlantica]|uniref:DUF6841 domain-containing protein n=1 Tax=Aliterella atlantica CENA595 TaxID=1618023 RepID=A0A0D8ZLZ7_9CYAN|nr:hypothetical protein [Aliterella atlantica]KJH69848.1 hypothetical protein UH38_21715 [Aliterella atlantica CENA595]
MSDEDDVLETFKKYSSTFELLSAKALLHFYHYPCILISQDKSAALRNQIEAWIALKKVIADLKQENYKKSWMRDLQVKLQSSNLATITGIAERLRKDGSVIIEFGFTYTLRKVSSEWKIIVGIIHDVLPPN